MKRTLTTLAAAALLAAATLPAHAGGSDDPTPYTVTPAGITFPAPLSAHGHVNVRTDDGTGHGLHFDPNNSHPGAAWIGETFLPWSALGITDGCVVWVQWSEVNEHYGEGGQPPVCLTEPDPEPTPDPTDEPSEEPSEEPTEEPTLEPTPDPTGQPEPTPAPEPDPTNEPSEEPSWPTDPTPPASPEPSEPPSDPQPSGPPSPTPNEPNEPKETGPTPNDDEPKFGKIPPHTVNRPPSSPSTSSTPTTTSDPELAQTGTSALAAVIAGALITAGVGAGVYGHRRATR